MRQLQKKIHYSHTSVYHSVNMTKKVEEGFVQTRSFDKVILQNIVAEHYNAEKNIARIANAVQVPICLLVSTSVY